MKNQNERVQELFSHLPEGVAAAELYAQSSEDFSVGLTNGELDDYSVSESGGFLPARRLRTHWLRLFAGPRGRP